MIRLALGRMERRERTMSQLGTPTRYPGVYKVPETENTYLVRAIAVDPRTGKKKAKEKLLEGVSAPQAARFRSELIEQIKRPAREAKRMRVGEFARSWIASKALQVDDGTARTYAAALEDHALPVLGDYFYDEVTPLDVQRWIDDSLCGTWNTASRTNKTRGARCSDKQKAKRRTEQRRYARNTVAGWLRVFRTMTQDAVVQLQLPLDPTMRVRIAEPVDESEESKAVTPPQFVDFLAAFRAHYPQHYALVVLLAYTGLRFCHASALRWEDWDEQASVVRVVRKQRRGKVGPLTRKKRAPKLIAVQAELADVLRWHRDGLRDGLKEKALKAGVVVIHEERLADGWMFPSSAGTLRAPSSLDRAWEACLRHAAIEKRFTVHGLRYTFTDLLRKAKVDPVLRRQLVGHVTEEMQRKYSTVDIEESRAAMAAVFDLVPLPRMTAIGGGVTSGVSETRNEQQPAEALPPTG
jgi:integrase